MPSPQVLRLTDEQIEQTYLYFETGAGIPPVGVVMRDSFTKTMGRVWDCMSGHYIIFS